MSIARKTVVGLCCVLAGAMCQPSSSAGAATTVVHIAGNFVGDDRVEIFEYRAGTGADYLYANFSKETGSVTYNQYSFIVPGTYTPFSGDFDGDGHDELFWYGGGDGADHLWKFTDVTSFTQHEIPQGSLYFPVPGDFDGDGADEILWYAPGTVPDEIWDFAPGDVTRHTVQPITITGDYVALAGNFTGDGAEDVILYGRGDIADHLFDFDPGSLTPTRTPFGPLTGADHRPFTLDSRADGWTDVFFYQPGTDGDPYWNFTAAGIQKTVERVDGTYDTATGDLFGDGNDDIFWFGRASSVWDWHQTATGLTVTHRPFGVP
jgi:FG-GAP-like repeat